jgi:type I restriction enzyme S subunit
LGEVCRVFAGSAAPQEKQYFIHTGPYFFRVSDLASCGRTMDLSESQDRLSSEALATCQLVAVRKGTVVFPKSGAAIATNNRALLSVDGYIVSHLMALEPTDAVAPEWVYHVMCQIDMLRYSDNVGYPSLKQSVVEKIQIPLPPIVEQQRITALLREQMAAVERARVAAQDRIEAIKQLPLAYYRDAFGQSLAFSASPVTPTKPTRPGWRWHRLTDLARLATGHTPSRYHPEYWTGEIPWVQLADIRALDGKEVFDTCEHTNVLGIENSAAVLLPKGTVCMSRTASVGFFAIMGRPMATSQDFVNWVCGPDLDPWFLMHLLISCRRAIRDLGSGAVHQTIYFPTVESFNVCIPSLTEQQRTAELLREHMTAVRKARAGAEQEIQAIIAMPAALLRRAFNGVVRNGA